MNIYGYIRVSSRDQNEDRQLLSLKQIGVLEKNIYLDKQSGAISKNGTKIKERRFAVYKKY